jgi:hypothetical protein
MDRDMILIEGGPGSHHEQLARGLAKETYSQLFVEHISFTTILRSLGYSALEALDHKETYDIMSDALTQRNSAGLILITDYLQHVDQIEDLDELAMLDDRNLAGLIIAETPYDEQILRIVGESPQPITIDGAKKLLLSYQQRHDPIIVELTYREAPLPVQFVDTTGSETRVIYNGVHAIQQLLARDNYEDKNAS